MEINTNKPTINVEPDDFDSDSTEDIINSPAKPQEIQMPPAPEAVSFELPSGIKITLSSITINVVGLCDLSLQLLNKLSSKVSKKNGQSYFG